MRPEFLTSPGAWIRSGSRSVDVVRDACALERSHRRQHRFVSWCCVLAFVAMFGLLIVENFA